MTRTTNSDLQQILVNIERRIPNAGWEISNHSGRVRLERKNGSVEVSPRLTKGELRDWMRAFIMGIDAARMEN